MKDLHTHIMYGVDDGSKTLEESLIMLHRLEESGVTDVVLTPHYIEDTRYSCNNKDKIKLYKEICSKAEEIGLNINIYLGNEVMVNNNLLESLDTEILRINNSRYLLIETNLNKEFPDFDLIINELLDNNIIPIFAHPERYLYVQKDYKWLNKYIEAGMLCQGDCESLFNKYGKKANKTLIKLLKKDMIHFFGSDIHRKETKINIKELEGKLKKIVKDDKKIEDLLKNNFDKVIRNKEI
jgi:protein-tyrosine phosphatase